MTNFENRDNYQNCDTETQGEQMLWKMVLVVCLMQDCDRISCELSPMRMP